MEFPLDDFERQKFYIKGEEWIMPRDALLERYIKSFPDEESCNIFLRRHNEYTNSWMSSSVLRDYFSALRLICSHYKVLEFFEASSSEDIYELILMEFYMKPWYIRVLGGVPINDGEAISGERKSNLIKLKKVNFPKTIPYRYMLYKRFGIKTRTAEKNHFERYGTFEKLPRQNEVMVIAKRYLDDEQFLKESVDKIQDLVVKYHKETQRLLQENDSRILPIICEYCNKLFEKQSTPKMPVFCDKCLYKHVYQIREKFLGDWKNSGRRGRCKQCPKPAQNKKNPVLFLNESGICRKCYLGYR